ncbi:MAG TPA: hypothetical protein VN843_36100 [Anaerolineales bacterium]|nr:hypothetical protein [Anaerolineales bacterium]
MSQDGSRVSSGWNADTEGDQDPNAIWVERFKKVDCDKDRNEELGDYFNDWTGL